MISNDRMQYDETKNFQLFHLLEGTSFKPTKSTYLQSPQSLQKK